MADSVERIILYLYKRGLTNLDGIELPESLLDLHLSWNKLTSIDDVKLPSHLSILNMDGNQISSISGIVFPETLLYLNINCNRLTSLVGIRLPKKLKTFGAKSNLIEALDFTGFPPTLEVLDFGNNPIKNLNGVRFPPNVHRIFLQGLDAIPIADLEGVQIGSKTIVHPIDLHILIKVASRKTAARHIQFWYRRLHKRRYQAATKIQSWWFARSFHRRGLVYQRAIEKIDSF